MRKELKFLQDTRDIPTALMKAAESGMTELGNLDVINAYSQMYLPKAIRPYTMFRLGTTYYEYKRLPFGLAPAHAVLGTYLGVHLEIMKAKFL